MDDISSLAHLSITMLLVILVMGAIAITLNIIGDVQNPEEDLQVVKQESSTEDSYESVTEYFNDELTPSVTPEIVENIFNNDFIKHNNPRVILDEILLNAKAQELFEQKNVQLYVVTVDTKEKDSVDVRKEASRQASKISDDYKAVLTITDNGTFWFYGNYVNDFLTANDKLELSEIFAATYTIEPYKPFKLNTYVICIIIVCITVVAGTSIHMYLNIQKHRADAVILNTKLEKMPDEVDALVSKYKDGNYDSSFKQ